MEWQDYIKKIMVDYTAKRPDEKTFPATRIIEGLRDLSDIDETFGKMYNSFKDSIKLVKHIGSVLDEMESLGIIGKNLIDKNTSGSYFLR